MLRGLAYVPGGQSPNFYKDYIEKQIEKTLEKDEEWPTFVEEIQAFVVYFRKTLSIEEAILHCLLQIYGINMKLYCRVVHRPTKCLRAITGRLTV